MRCRTQTNDTAHAVKAWWGIASSTAVSDEPIHYTRSAQVKAHQDRVCVCVGGVILFCCVESLAPSVDSI